MRTLTVVIPAAGRGRRVAGLKVPKPLIRIGGRTAVERVIAEARAWLGRRYRLSFRVVVGRGGSGVRRLALGPGVSFYRQARPTGPLTAVLAARPGPGGLLIWPVDTLFGGRFPRPLPDAVYVGPAARRWDLVRVRAGRVAEWSERPHRGLRLTREWRALVGVYWLSDGARFRRLARDIVRRGGRVNGEFQIPTALRAIGGLRAARAPRWLDTGTPAGVARARKALG